MNLINNRRFLYFKKYNTFLQAQSLDMDPNAIAFIEDRNAIWTHGHMFGDEGEHAKGFFSSIDELPTENNRLGDWGIVNVDGLWYIYSYNSYTKEWEQKGEYEIKDISADTLKLYIKRDEIYNYVRNIYDNIYVKKSEVYTPDIWESNGNDLPNNGTSGGSSSGNVFNNIDRELKESLNPVANYVIYRKFNVIQQVLDHKVDEKRVLEIINKSIEDLPKSLNDYYTKAETYSRSEIDDKLSKVTMNVEIVDSIDQMVDSSVMYMIKDKDYNTYTTYVHTSTGWVEFGKYEFDIDLSKYVKVETLRNYVTNNDFYNALTDVNTSISEIEDSINESTKDVVKWPKVYTPDQMPPQSDNTIDEPGYHPNRAPQASRPTEEYATWNRVKQYIDTFLNTGVTPDIPKHIILEESEYNALTSYEQNTLYFVLEPNNEIDTNWTFGGTFPVIFAAEGLGTFPINLK